MVLVDSSVWIEAGRRDGKLEVKVALESLLKANAAGWCSVVKLEVVGRAAKEQRKQLEFFFSTIPYLTINESIWNEAKRLSWELRDHGLSVPVNDILITALAIKRDIRVYAIDNHFLQMAKIAPLRLYEPGYGGSYSEGEG